MPKPDINGEPTYLVTHYPPASNKSTFIQLHTYVHASSWKEACRIFRKKEPDATYVKVDGRSIK